jgi:undecaprenyl-diphosphatase
MDIVSAFILGAIQGFTEWLPVSSSGHLVLAQHFMGLEVPAEFDIVIMAGTTLALLIYFREKILSLAKGCLALEKQSANYLLLIIIAGVPTAAAGFALHGFFKSLFSQPLIVAFLLIVTGVFLVLAQRFSHAKGKLGAQSAALVGLAQGLAVAPGISRSGSTIGTALLLGIKPREAAEFSFLIGAPAMAAASFLEFLGSPAAGVEPAALAAGTLSALFFGYLSIGFFMSLLQKGKFHWFGYYCICAGATAGLLILSGF